MSWFKNITAYRLGKAAKAWTAVDLAGKLAPHAFQPCGGLCLSSTGWVAPIDGGPLAYGVSASHLFLALCTEKRVIPAQTIERHTRERCAALAKEQGFTPGRKQAREVKERVIDELLPRAFTTRGITHVWLDTRNGWLVMDSASPARCDDVFRMLLRAVDDLPVTTLRVNRSPVASMTEWLETDSAPYNFTVDDDAELRTGGPSRPTVRFINHTLDAVDIGRHIGAGKVCTRLAMTWDDRISFVLTDSLAIKRVVPLDVLREDRDDDASAEADLLLMAGEFNNLLRGLVDALGGEHVENA